MNNFKEYKVMIIKKKRKNRIFFTIHNKNDLYLTFVSQATLKKIIHRCISTEIKKIMLITTKRSFNLVYKPQI